MSCYTTPSCEYNTEIELRSNSGDSEPLGKLWSQYHATSSLHEYSSRIRISGNRSIRTVKRKEENAPLLSVETEKRGGSGVD